ncbi:MAG: glutathione S-transferase family protein [Rhodospirillaceae bacterium]
MAALTLVIGNKAYSSWSLRPWLALRQAGAVFDEVVIPLRQPETRAAILRHSAAGKVPVLHIGGGVVWESLAICEAVAEAFPAAGLWPEDPVARAVARAAASEMHGGFAEVRRAFPMDLKREPAERPVPDVAASEIARLTSLWCALRRRFGAGGPFLFGRFTIADAMYAPVCARFDSYRVPLDAVSRDYLEAVLALPAFLDWRQAALAEPWTIAY